MNINDEKDFKEIYSNLDKSCQEGANVEAAFRLGCLCARQNLMKELIQESKEGSENEFA